jgi:hypothetical protein
MTKLIVSIVIALSLVGCHSLSIKGSPPPPVGSFGGAGGGFGGAGGGFGGAGGVLGGGF